MSIPSEDPLPRESSGHSADFLRRIAIDHAVEAIMICDAAGRIVEVNRAFTLMTGYILYEVLGRLPGEVFWEDDAGRLGEIEAGLAARGHWKGEGRGRRKDGTLYLESRSMSVARDGAGGIVSRIVVFSDVTGEKEDERRIAFLAHHDALTGLPNRAMFMHECSEAIFRAQRRRSRVALLYVDLDEFKQVNDSHGHAAGDAVLRAVAPRVQECVRKTDILARLGGDEFTVVIDDVQDPRDLAAIARKIIERLGDPFAIAGEEVQISASIGIACYPDDAIDVDSLLAAADTAMYAAKAQGRNNSQYFSVDLNARALESLIVASNLRQAVVREEFSLAFQPRVELDGGKITAVEALIRWNHPELGPVLPTQFIAVAEKTGLIDELGGWVLEAACRQMSAWRAARTAPPRVSINLALRQFRQPALLEKIARALDAAGLEPDALQLEVTEGTLMDDPVSAAQILRRIRQLGVTVAIDDFGTGFSSLNHLQRFEVDYIKIDQSFVRGIPVEATEVRITDAIIAIARTMGVKLIAEGIETPQQFEYLRNARCEEGQGYLFSRPVAESELASMLAAGTLAASHGTTIRIVPHTLDQTT
ncbi:MAG TPA: EAL domain-containing protein [Burkholderiales bacterium]|nr:EAL domain-containing protein [Burkholderiales bacterium]